LINHEVLPHEYVTTQTAWERNTQLRCQLDEGMWNKLKERIGCNLLKGRT